MSFRNLEGQIARWLERIQQYNFEVIYRKGKLHDNANDLSRCPCEETNCNYCNKVDSKREELGRIIFREDDHENCKKDQLEDPVLMKIFHEKEGQRPSWKSFRKILPLKFIGHNGIL